MVKCNKDYNSLRTTELFLFFKQIPKDTPYERRKASDAVRKELEKESLDLTVAVRCIAVELPSQEEHSGHVVGKVETDRTYQHILRILLESMTVKFALTL